MGGEFFYQKILSVTGVTWVNHVRYLDKTCYLGCHGWCNRGNAPWGVTLRYPRLKILGNRNTNTFQYCYTCYPCYLALLYDCQRSAVCVCREDYDVDPFRP